MTEFEATVERNTLPLIGAPAPMAWNKLTANTGIRSQALFINQVDQLLADTEK
jgi:hypothetical protein